MCDIRTESVVLEEAHKALRARLGHATPSTMYLQAADLSLELASGRD